jgi:hypothetical protein
MIFIKWVVVAAWLVGANLAYAAEGSRVSQGSFLSAEGASTIVAGSVEVIASSATLTVKAVQASAEGAVVVLAGASEAATVSVTVTSEIAAGLSNAMGATVEVVAESAGYALIHAGKMIAFIPNELSKSLLRHSPHPQ